METPGLRSKCFASPVGRTMATCQSSGTEVGSLSQNTTDSENVLLKTRNNKILFGIMKLNKSQECNGMCVCVFLPPGSGLHVVFSGCV